MHIDGEITDMKTRAGFVSNSSSSSFIVKWRFIGDRDFYDENVNWHVNRCVAFWDKLYDEEGDEWLISKEKCIKNKQYDHPILSLINVAENTTRDANLFTTEIFTSMLNDSIRDYGQGASDLVMGLLTSPYYELITTYEED